MFKVVDSNALGEEEAFEVDYASRLFNFHVLKDFFNPCQYNENVEKEAYLKVNHDENDPSNSQLKDLDLRKLENV